MMTSEEFAQLGKGHVGYIRPVQEDDGTGFELRDAQGEQLATAETFEAALFAAEHLSLQPVTLH